MMGGLRNFWPLWLVIITLNISFSCISEARHQPNTHKPSAIVVGAVFCETCFQDDMSKGSHYISGATVAVECAEGASRPSFYKEIKTDKQGNFKVQLPFSISKHVKKIEGCTVKLVKSSEPYCAVASTATSSLVHLNDKKGGKHIFSAGFFTFKPLKQPGLCNQQPSVTNSQLYSLGDLFQNPEVPSIPTLPNPQVPTLPTPNPPISTNPNTPVMPNWPNLPSLPSLPELPKLPTLPFLPPFPKKPVTSFKDEKVENGFVKPQQVFPPIIPPVLPSPPGPLPTVPNPFQPPPLLPNPFQPPAPPLIPNPFQPPATPAPLIPNPFQPPSPPPTILPPLPPLPNLPNVPGVPDRKSVV